MWGAGKALHILATKNNSKKMLQTTDLLGIRGTIEYEPGRRRQKVFTPVICKEMVQMAEDQMVGVEVRILEAAAADVTFADWMNDFSDEDGF